MNEKTLIKLVIDKSRIVRFEQFLSKPNKRKRMLEKLNHNPPLNEKRTKWFTSINDALKSINIKTSDKVILIIFSN